MGWQYSDSSSTPPNYTYFLTNYMNQCASRVIIPDNCAVTQIKVYAAGYYADVDARLVVWASGGSVKVQSSTFTLSAGSTGAGNQAWHTKSVTATYLTAGTYWAGLYTDPSIGRILGTTSSGTTGYTKTNTATFPSVSSMSGYTSDDKRMYVAMYVITAPVAPSSLSVTRVSDTSQTISFTNNAVADQPYDNVKIYRKIYGGSYSLIATISGSATSYTDTTTVANRHYYYKALATNTVGNSSYSNEDDINTTPGAPTNVTATRVSGNVSVTWTDNATNEGYYKVQRRTSADGITYTSYVTLTSTLAANSTSYSDTSPANYNQYKISCTCTNPSLESTQVTSNIVVIAQPPDQPSNLTPDDYVFDATEPLIFDWTHNPTDGSDITKFSIRIKESSGNYPKNIENFTNASDWTTSNSVASDQSSIKLYGTNAVSFSDSNDTAGYCSLYRSVSAMDLTVFEDSSASGTDDLIVFLFYISDITKYTSVGIKLGTDNSNCYYNSYTPSVSFTNGWNRIVMDKASFTTAGTVNWNNITYIRVETYTTANASTAFIVCQGLYMVDVSPTFTGYAGDYFSYYGNIEVSTEGMILFDDSFINGNDYVWQVKTWGDATTGGTFSDGSSDWSDEATFKTVTTPVPTITNPTVIDTYSYSTLTVEWTYTQAESYNQVQYLVNLYDENNTLLETSTTSSTIANGSDDSHTFSYVLSNSTEYIVGVKVQETNGLWSDEETVTFTTDFLQPTKPSISLDFVESNATMNISITNPDVVTVYNELSTQDSYVDNDNASTNYNDNGQLQIENDTAGGTTIKTILLDFDLSFFVDKTIVNATLILTRKTTLTPGIYSKVNYIKTSWDETTVNYSTLPTLDATAYDTHIHVAGDTEAWDITTLLEDIADGTITDFEGMAVVATSTDGSTDEFYDSTITDSEPYVIVQIEPLNEETDHNDVYRSIDGGEWVRILSDVPKNTIVTDYTPSIGGNNNYYVEALSALPSSNASDEVDEDVLLYGYYYINAGEGFESYVGFIENPEISENYNKDLVLNRYEGRIYPVKYQGTQIEESIGFSADILKELRNDVKTLVEADGDMIFRDHEGRWFYCSISGNSFSLTNNTTYRFSCTITRVEST